MTAKVTVRGGKIPAGPYTIDTKRGRIQQYGSPDVSVQGANITVLSQDGAGASMAKAGAAGALLLGGAGLAIGVLTAKKGTVLFEAILQQGGNVLGQCNPAALQELMIAQRSTYVPPAPPAGGNFWNRPRSLVWLSLIVIIPFGYAFLAALLPSSPSALPVAAAAAPQAPHRSESPATIDPIAARVALLMRDIAPFDGTERSTRIATKRAVLITRQEKLDCRTASFVAAGLADRGHKTALANFRDVMRDILCAPKPTERRAKAKSPSHPKVSDEELDDLARRAIPATSVPE